MTKEEYQDFVLRYKGCGACFPLYEKLSKFEKMWFTAIQKDVAELKLKLEALEGETPWKDIKDKSEVIGQLTKAKEIIKKYMRFKPVVGGVQYYHEEYEQTEKEAEQFLEEIKENDSNSST